MTYANGLNVQADWNQTDNTADDYIKNKPGLTAAENQADSTAADVAGLKADLNALLAKLKAAGLMEADEEE